MSAVNMVLEIPPLTALVYLVVLSAVRCMALLAGLLIALRGTTETTERIKAYTAFTDAMTVRWPAGQGHPRWRRVGCCGEHQPRRLTAIRGSLTCRDS